MNLSFTANNNYISCNSFFFCPVLHFSSRLLQVDGKKAVPHFTPSLDKNVWKKDLSMKYLISLSINGSRGSGRKILFIYLYYILFYMIFSPNNLILQPALFFSVTSMPSFVFHLSLLYTPFLFISLTASFSTCTPPSNTHGAHRDLDSH